MQAPERAPPRSAADVGSKDEGLPWVRLITGLVALAMLAVPVGRHVADSDTQPIVARVVTAQALPPAQPLPRPALPSREPDDPSTALATEAAGQVRSMTPDGTEAVDLAQRRDLRAAAAPRDVRRVATARRQHAHRRLARAQRVLTRAQVVREYLASREQVAAFTGEDSGSAWLARMSAQRRAARERIANGPARPEAAALAGRSRTHRG